MRPVIPPRYLLPLGLFILAASFMVKRFGLPDFADGFLKGVGIGVIVLSLIHLYKARQTSDK